MNIYIFVDMEGISGIVNSSFVAQDGALYHQARKYYTYDINACAKGCFKAGAKKVTVRDGHGGGCHAIWDELDPRIEIIQGVGTPRKRFPGIEECDALILLGYHAMAGTRDAVLEHTYSSKSIQNIWLNGKAVGEFGLDSAIAADYNIPTIMTSGDDKICKEAKKFIPGIITCEVKKALSCQGARLLPMKKAHQLIEDKTVEAISKINSIKPPPVKKPVKMRKELIERGSIKTGPGVKIIDGRTYEVQGATAEEAFYSLF